MFFTVHRCAHTVEALFPVVLVRAVSCLQLVVTAQQEDVLWIENFHCEEIGDHFHAVLSSINIVAEEEIARRHCLRGFVHAKHLGEAHEICVVAVDVAKDIGRRGKLCEGLLTFDTSQ